MREKQRIPKVLKLLMASLMLVMLFGMTSMAAGSATVNMKQAEKNVYVSVGSYGNYVDVYNKIVVKKPSMLAVSGYCEYPNINTQGSLRITLLSKKKKVLEESASYVDFNEKDYAVYGVTAGTYYIKVSGVKMFALEAQLTPVTDKGASAKKKAATISAGKTVKGLLCAGEKASRADWYKFKMTKNKVLELTVSVNSEGYFEFYVYGPSYPNGARLGSLKNQKGVYYSTNQLSGKKASIKAGTYYLKVSRTSYSKKASGMYSIMWKMK